MLGYDPERIEVLLYQLVHLTRGGEQAKMSKRRGDVVFLDDFMDEIGVDAARWYLVNRGPDQTIEIDIDLAAEKIEQEPGLLRPVRPCPHRRHPPRRAASCRRRVRPAARSSLQERELIKRLAEFPGRRARGDSRRGAAGDPVYAIKVADDFHRFYHDVRVLGSRRPRRSGSASAARRSS